MISETKRESILERYNNTCQKCHANEFCNQRINMNKKTQQEMIFAVIEAGEVIGRNGDTVSMPVSLAKRIYKELARFNAKKFHSKRTPEQRSAVARHAAQVRHGIVKR